MRKTASTREQRLNKELLNRAYKFIIRFTGGKHQSINMGNMQIHFIIIKDNEDKITCTKLKMLQRFTNARLWECCIS